jgi:hypothetical protein
MNGIRKLGPQAFDVDLGAFDGFLARWFGGPVAVDPFRVGSALRAVMGACDVRTATGRSLLWNDYRVFLRPADWEGLRALGRRTQEDLASILLEEVHRQNAEIVGVPLIRLLVDEAEGGDAVAAGHVVVRVAFSEPADLAAVPDDGMTIRVGAPGARPAVAHVPAPSRSDATQRVEEPGPGARLAWPGGQAWAPLGARVLLGRPHDGAPPGFVPLVGAGATVNKVQAWIEVQRDGVRIGRLSQANPVQVDGRVLQPGGDVDVARGAVVLRLSNELEISVALERR